MAKKINSKKSEELNHELNPKVVSFSLAIISGITYVLCAVFFVLAPQATLGFFKEMFHGIDITKIAVPSVPLGSAVFGFVEIVVFSLIAGWLFAAIYNYLLKRF